MLPEQFEKENELLSTIFTTVKLLGYKMKGELNIYSYEPFYSYVIKLKKTNIYINIFVRDNQILYIHMQDYDYNKKVLSININSYYQKNHIEILQKTLKLLTEL